MTLCGFPPLQDEMTEKELELESKTQRGVKAPWVLHFVLRVWQVRPVDDLKIWPIGQACKYGQSFRWWLLTYHVPAMTSLSIYSCWIMLIGGPPKQIAFGMNIGSWCDLTASCVQNMSFQNCMLCIFVPVTSKYICDSLRSMVKLKLEPFHKQTSLSDPLEVSCH